MDDFRDLTPGSIRDSPTGDDIRSNASPRKVLTVSCSARVDRGDECRDPSIRTALPRSDHWRSVRTQCPGVRRVPWLSAATIMMKIGNTSSRSRAIQMMPFFEPSGNYTEPGAPFCCFWNCQSGMTCQARARYLPPDLCTKWRITFATVWNCILEALSVRNAIASFAITTTTKLL